MLREPGAQGNRFVTPRTFALHERANEPPVPYAITGYYLDARASCAYAMEWDMLSWPELPPVEPGVYQAVEKRPPAALRSLFVTAAYKKYASFLTLSRALHPGIFEQPAKNDFFKTLLKLACAARGTR
jgi:hypothetical protein